MKYIKVIIISLFGIGIVISISLYILLSSVNNEHYKNINEFRKDISKWGILNKTDKTARNIFEEKGFRCYEKYIDREGRPVVDLDNTCHKDLVGLPCNQRLRVKLVTDENNAVIETYIWEIDGAFPTQCL